jgi:GT2 family glycosyltransferase
MLHIVLPAHNRQPVTESFVRALSAQTVGDYRLLLIDDGCTDGTVAEVQLLLPAERLVVIHGDGQLWWAGALQRAWELLSASPTGDADAVLIINDDVGIEPDFLAAGLAVLSERPEACIQAMGIDKSSGKRDHGAVADRVRLRFRAAAEGELPNCLSTRGLLMSLRTFAASGGFRPDRLPHYLSDYEFTLRLARRGVPLVVDPRFRLVADPGSSGDDDFDGRSLREFIARSLSNRAKYNPRHWAALAWMVCPWWIAPLRVARIWAAFVRRGLRVALASGASRSGPRPGPPPATLDRS